MAKWQRRMAIKTKVAGHKAIGLPEDEYTYDSKLEAKCAQIFLRDGIRFKPHVKFGCFDKELQPFSYTVDFLFDEPQKLRGISPAVNGIEVKGYLSGDDILRIESLKFFHDIRVWIAAENLVDMWEREGTRGQIRTKSKHHLGGNPPPEDGAR